MGLQKEAHVRFEGLSTSARAALDCFVFPLMRRRAQEAPAELPERERRLTHRVVVGESENLIAILLPEATRGAFATTPLEATEAVAFPLSNISTTGCSLRCSEASPFRPREKIRLRLKGRALDVEIQAKVLSLG